VTADGLISKNHIRSTGFIAKPLENGIIDKTLRELEASTFHYAGKVLVNVAANGLRAIEGLVKFIPPAR
jgi:hypothetical protein